VSEELEADIQALPKVNINELRAKWKSALKQQPPLHIRKQLMVPLLAYKLQEQAYGGLKPPSRDAFGSWPRALRKVVRRNCRDASSQARA
jgi:hypothetical protein